MEEPEAPAFTEPTVLLYITRSLKEGKDLYEATRGHWRIGAKARNTAEVALGVASGVVKSAYRIDGWFPSPNEAEAGRWGFEGHEDPALDQFIGTSVRHLLKGNRSTVRLFLNPPG